MKFKILISIALLIITTSVMAGIFDKIGDFLDRPWSKDLPVTTVTISDMKYTPSGVDENGWSATLNKIAGKPPITSQSVSIKGRIYNNSDKLTIDSVSIKIEIAECSGRGVNCTIIDERTIGLYSKIPPKQARYLKKIITYEPGGTGGINFRHSVDSVRAK